MRWAFDDRDDNIAVVVSLSPKVCVLFIERLTILVYIRLTVLGLPSGTLLWLNFSSLLLSSIRGIGPTLLPSPSGPYGHLALVEQHIIQGI